MVRNIDIELSLNYHKNYGPGAHNKYEPEIEAGVSKISVQSTWNMDQSFGYNVYEGPDAAVRVSMSE